MKKVALVTGGSSGIGKAISFELAKNKISVGLTYSENKKGAIQVVNHIRNKGGIADAYNLKVENRYSVVNAIKYFSKNLGPINILVNNAGISQFKNFKSISDSDWNKIMNINLRGAFICSQETLPYMLSQKWGRIINIASIGGIWGGVNQVHYAVSKAGMIGLTKSLANLYGEKNVNTNAIAPGLVRTDMIKKELKKNINKNIIKKIPIGRIAEPKEIAKLVMHLVSDSGSYINGQTININGGMYIG